MGETMIETAKPEEKPEGEQQVCNFLNGKQVSLTSLVMVHFNGRKDGFYLQFL